MMGTQHALTGALAWSGFITAFPQQVLPTALGYAVCAGSALLPDIDHPGSTISKSLGPVTKGLCLVVTWLSGGHRRGTHSLFGCAVFTGLVALAEHFRDTLAGGIATAVVLLLLLFPIPRLLRLPGLYDEMIAVALAVVLVVQGADLSLLPLWVAIGTLTHLLGDAITKQGIPVWWPWRRKNYRIATMTAGSKFETRFLRWVFVLAIPAIPLWDDVARLLAR
jgi:membrane-bound metal-dependent hydrolase YbcI (DUF457 family)